MAVADPGCRGPRSLTLFLYPSSLTGVPRIGSLRLRLVMPALLGEVWGHCSLACCRALVAYLLEQEILSGSSSVSCAALVIGEDLLDLVSRYIGELRVGLFVVGEGDQPDGQRPAATSCPSGVIDRH